MKRHVLFRVSAQTFAVPLGEVREVVVAPTLFTKVPRAPSAVKGVINLRGRIVTAVDFGSLFSLPPPATRPDPTLARIVLLEGGGRDIGLLVDEVRGISELENEGSAPAGGPPEVVGLSRAGNESVTVLGAESLLAAVRGRFGVEKGS